LPNELCDHPVSDHEPILMWTSVMAYLRVVDFGYDIEDRGHRLCWHVVHRCTSFPGTCIK